MGDAAFGMAGLDIETAVRSKIPILTIILNNGVMTNYTSDRPYLEYAAKEWDLHKIRNDKKRYMLNIGIES